MIRPYRSWLSPVVLLIWMVPGAGTLAVGLHLTLEHGPHAAEGTPEVARDDIERHHDHEWSGGEEAEPALCSDGFSSEKRDLDRDFGAALTASLPSLAALGSSVIDPRSRRGPPLPLFATHCSLLL